MQNNQEECSRKHEKYYNKGGHGGNTRYQTSSYESQDYRFDKEQQLYVEFNSCSQAKTSKNSDLTELNESSSWTKKNYTSYTEISRTTQKRRRNYFMK